MIVVKTKDEKFRSRDFAMRDASSTDSRELANIGKLRVPSKLERDNDFCLGFMSTKYCDI